jgi:hypothetical protein
MMRIYKYEGFTLEVSVESDFSVEPGRREGRPAHPGYIAVVKIFQAGNTVAAFSPLRFGELGGRPFATEIDALIGGYGAARKIVDDLFCQDRH